jgi:hypothetical protein
MSCIKEKKSFGGLLFLAAVPEKDVSGTLTSCSSHFGNKLTVNFKIFELEL